MLHGPYESPLSHFKYMPLPAYDREQALETQCLALMCPLQGNVLLGLQISSLKSTAEHVRIDSYGVHLLTADKMLFPRRAFPCPWSPNDRLSDHARGACHQFAPGPHRLRLAAQSCHQAEGPEQNPEQDQQPEGAGLHPEPDGAHGCHWISQRTFAKNASAISRLGSSLHFNQISKPIHASAISRNREREASHRCVAKKFFPGQYPASSTASDRCYVCLLHKRYCLQVLSPRLHS